MLRIEMGVKTPFRMVTHLAIKKCSTFYGVSNNTVRQVYILVMVLGL